MKLWDKLKGVFKNMITPKSIEDAIRVTPLISTRMRESIETWDGMYRNKPYWVNDKTTTLGLAPLISSEKARMATLEMQVKVTGDSKRSKRLSEDMNHVIRDIKKQLEYGIALGGLVLKPYVFKGPNDEYQVNVGYVKANNFYPLSFSSDNKVTECVFVDRVITKDCIYTKLEYHKLDGTDLCVRNTAYKKATNATIITPQTNMELGSIVPLAEVSEWASLEPEVYLKNVPGMLFSYFKMPLANNIDLDSPLGVSGFSRAVDLIKNADEQYSNLLWEFEGGQLALDVDRSAFNPMKDSSGKITYALPKFQDRLYRRDLDLGSDDMYNIFSPELRDTSIINGLNTILMQVEDACSLSRGTLSKVEHTDARTATELKIIKQRSYAANADIQCELERCLKEVVDIIDAYYTLYNVVEDGTYDVSYCWDDSIIVDKDAEKQMDLIEVDKGLMSKVEYRMKWKGETENQATQELERISKEKEEAMEIQQSILIANNPQGANGKQPGDFDDKTAKGQQNKKQQANASGNATKSKEKE